MPFFLLGYVVCAHRCAYIYLFIFISCSSQCFVAFAPALGVILIHVVKMGSTYCM